MMFFTEYGGYEPPNERRGFVHGKIGGAIKGVVKGVGKVVKKVLPLAPLALPFVPGIGGLAGKALGFLKNNPALAAGGIAAIQNARTQGKRDDIRDELLGNVREDRARRTGFLDQINVDSFRNLSAPDLGAVFADPNNPFARTASQPVPGVIDPLAAQPIASVSRLPRKKKPPSIGGLAKQGGVGSAVRGV